MIGIADFKRAMRALPAQVCVIAARAGDTRIAMTATAVTSLSAEPPQILICVHRAARPAAVIREAGAFSVHLLSTAQVDVATQCALPALAPEARFDVGDWGETPLLGQPLLAGTPVALECRLSSESEQGTHHVLTGLIEGAWFAEGKPLMYHDASYREIGPRLDALHLEWDNQGLAF